jgi:hypothetical protein
LPHLAILAAALLLLSELFAPLAVLVGAVVVLFALPGHFTRHGWAGWTIWPPWTVGWLLRRAMVITPVTLLVGFLA